jgi:ADP-ribosylglycohydrolase
MLGAIVGDIVGSVYEFNNYRAKDFEPLFHPRASFTDDTVCTVAIADALVFGRDPSTTLRDWCRRYWSNGGWGNRFALWIASDNGKPYNSLGNGGAMRVSAAGFLATSLDEAVKLSSMVTEITHNHPEGMRGAAATAVAIHLARQGLSSESIRSMITAQFGYELSMSVDQIRPGYRRSEKSQDSVPQALTCALEACSFEDAIRNAVSIGGDSDTIAAIAGSVAEALFGIPQALLNETYSRIPYEMTAVMHALYHRSPSGAP